MLNNRLLRRTAHFISRGGFTLVELLVVIAIIAILAGVALGPITAGIKKAQQSGGVQTTKSLQLSEFQYSSDNNNVYPTGSTLALFIQAMYPTYISDLGELIVNGAPNVTKYTGALPPAITQTTDSYDFAYYSTSTSGLTSSTPDGTPAVWSGTSTALNIPAAGLATGQTMTLTGDANSAFGTSGLAVCYKGGNAKFIAGPTCTIVDPGFPASSGAATSFGLW